MINNAPPVDAAAEIEEILAGPPSKLAFRALCAALARAGETPELLERCAAGLVAWPDEDVAAPWSWLAQLADGHVRAGWSLVRSVEVGVDRIGVKDVPPPDLAIAPGVRSLTCGTCWDEEIIGLLDLGDRFARLRSFSARYHWFAEAVGERFAASDLVAGLERLDLLGDHWNRMGSMNAPFRPPAGRPLRLRHVAVRAGDLIHLLESGLVPELRSARTIVESAQEARALAACAGVARLERLELFFRCERSFSCEGGPGPHFGEVLASEDEACEVFFAGADLSGLRALVLTGMRGPRAGLGERGLDAVVASGVLGRVSALEVRFLPAGDAVVARVVGALDRERVEELVLSSLSLTDAGARALAGRAFPRLRRLDLSGNVLGPEGARVLARECALPALERLDLSGSGSADYYCAPEPQPIGDEGARELAASPNSARLTHLALRVTGLGAAGLGAVLGLPLERLDVSHNPLEGWPSGLGDARAWRTLIALGLDECGLDDAEFEGLAEVDAPRLREVSLEFNALRERGGRALAGWAALLRLWRVGLHDSVLEDGAVVALASGVARRLLELDLEQDCWNHRCRADDAPPVAELGERAAFPDLDSVFLGVVDGYHGARYSCGFPAGVAGVRPELAAFLAHAEVVDLEEQRRALERIGQAPAPEPEPTDEERWDQDFRGRRVERHREGVARAVGFARSLAG